MDETTKKETVGLMDMLKINGNEQIRILAICSKFLDKPEFISQVSTSVGFIVNQNHFNVLSDVPALVLELLNVIKLVKFYKEVKDSNRLSVIMYSVLINVLVKNHSKLLNNVEVERLRQVYLAAVKLLQLDPSQIKIDKAHCLSCVAQSFKVFQPLIKDNIYVE